MSAAILNRRITGTPNGIEAMGNGRYRIPSFTGRGNGQAVYLTDLNNRTCDCPATVQCKHIRYAEDYSYAATAERAKTLTEDELLRNARRTDLRREQIIAIKDVLFERFL